MQIRISREEFLQGLQRIQSVVERKTTTPILANFLLEARGNQLTYVATDLELTCKGMMVTETIHEGVITLPARQTFDIVRELPTGTMVELRVGEDPEVREQRRPFLVLRAVARLLACLQRLVDYDHAVTSCSSGQDASFSEISVTGKGH
jgi:hypothetical protein